MALYPLLCAQLCVLVPFWLLSNAAQEYECLVAKYKDITIGATTVSDVHARLQVYQLDAYITNGCVSACAVLLTACVRFISLLYV
jgi:hypothetical protein